MKKIILIPVCFMLLLTACAPVKLPPESKYTIMNFQQPVKAARPKTRYTLLVTAPTANSAYATDKMLYMVKPLRLDAYSQNRWVSPPSEMLLPIFVNAIRNTHYFYAVASSPFAGVTNYRLDTRILALQQEFLHPVSQVRLMVQATLMNSLTNQVVATHVFNQVITAQMNDPYGGVLATRLAANIIAKQIARFTWQNVK